MKNTRLVLPITYPSIIPDGAAYNSDKPAKKSDLIALKIIIINSNDHD